mgnify:CR=1 FL=1
MNTASPLPFPRWDDAATAGMDEPRLLLYRSNLLGSDLRITNYGGGNTSAKITHKDPLTGQDVEVLWVKGSGGDVGSMKLDGFSTLYMDKLRALQGLLRLLRLLHLRSSTLAQFLQLSGLPLQLGARLLKTLLLLLAGLALGLGLRLHLGLSSG